MRCSIRARAAVLSRTVTGNLCPLATYAGEHVTVRTYGESGCGPRVTRP